MCSGLTSASSASKAFSKNFFKAVGIDSSHGSVLMITALSFMALIALLNLRGVGESVKANVVLTGVELTGLLIVIAVGGRG
jgi:APA family basic amino acid/polyamine antiporter